MPIASFAPSGVISLVAGSESASVELPTSGSPTIALVTNLGVSVAYLLLGSSTVAVTPATGLALLPGQSIPFTIGANTYLAAISDQPVPLNIVVGS